MLLFHCTISECGVMLYISCGIVSVCVLSVSVVLCYISYGIVSVCYR